METFGNIDGIKSVIEKKYTLNIDQVLKEKEKKLEEIDNEIRKKLTKLRSKMLSIKDTESKRKYSIILTEEKMKAMKQFQEKREELINSVFAEAEKRAKEITRNEKYIEYVKKNMPKIESFKIVADDDYYQKFFPELEIDKSITGVVFKSGEIIYDFDLNHLVESKKDSLRYELSEILFK